MHLNKFKLLLFACLLLCMNSATAFNFVPFDNRQVDTHGNAKQLVDLWNSINEQSIDKHDPYTIETWENLLWNEYQKAVKNKDSNWIFKLSIPLSFTYHSETKFAKGLPILQYLYHHKKILSPIQYKGVLIKLEEEYRATNNIEQAIIIRKERIQNNFINNYWEIYTDCGLYEAAKKELFQFVAIPPLYTTARLNYYFKVGELYVDMNVIDSAKKIYTKALAECIETIEVNKVSHQLDNANLAYWKTSFMGHIIKCNIKKGHYTNAISTLLNDIQNSYANSDNMADKMIALSQCYLYYKQPFKAKLYLDSANHILTEKVCKPLKLAYLLACSNYYTSINKNDSSLIYYKRYNTYRDELNQNIQRNQSILLLGQLELSNRRKELLESKQSLLDSIKKNDSQKTVLLILIFSLVLSIMLGIFLYLNSLAKSRSKNKIELQNKMINEHAQKIEAQFNHNETLLKELHHRVKNNLQVMYSLLNLQKRRNEDFDTIETLSSIQNRIQTMALVHQNLYTSGNFELVEIASYIKTLAHHLETIYKVDKQKIEVHFKIDESLQLPIEMVVATGLIVNEAVSNSFKYAFKNKRTGQIFIGLLKNENEIEIIIQDNGEGMQHLPNKENSLGMKLIDLMCKQLKATHNIELNNGVTHHIKFNLT